MIFASGPSHRIYILLTASLTPENKNKSSRHMLIIFLISPQKHILWVLIVSASGYFSYPILVGKSPKSVTGKQCTPRSDAAECGRSGSTLFALNTGISIDCVGV